MSADAYNNKTLLNNWYEDRLINEIKDQMPEEHKEQFLKSIL